MATKRTWKQKYQKAVEIMNWIINYETKEQERGYKTEHETNVSKGSVFTCKFILKKLKEYEEEN